MTFMMHTREGAKYEFVYTGDMRYSPNTSSICGYGSDDWIYLCKEKDNDCLLMFSDSAASGCGWMCYILSIDNQVDLANESIDAWFATMRMHTQSKIYALKLENIEEVRAVLPRVSRCMGKLKDEHFR